MDGVNTQKKLLAFFRKNKYIVIILVLGVVLMLLPTGDKSQESTPVSVIKEETVDLEEKLCRILGKIQGCGKVEVLLTQAGGEQIIYQTDKTSSSNGENISTEVQTVIIGDGSRGQQALIQQQLAPKWLGAVVVCQGGNDPKVRLAIVDAVSKATGLTADKITVLKMK